MSVMDWVSAGVSEQGYLGILPPELLLGTKGSRRVEMSDDGSSWTEIGQGIMIH